MADFYTHFSCLLDVGSPDNAARALDLYQAFMWASPVLVDSELAWLITRPLRVFGFVAPRI